MSDMTYLRCWLYACPDDQEEAAAGVLAGQWFLEFDDETVASREHVTGRYFAEEMKIGLGKEIAEELREAAPGASFFLWENPAYEQLGWLEAYTSTLGRFSGRCDLPGRGVLGYDEMAEVIRQVPAGSRATTDAFRGAVLAALDVATGGPWRRDWERKIPPGSSR